MLEVSAFIAAACALFLFSSGASASAIAAVVAVSSFLLSWQVKCPRCRLQVHSKDGVRGFGEKASKNCERCGRTRVGVWPFQYLVAPEPWGGERIDRK